MFRSFLLLASLALVTACGDKEDSGGAACSAGCEGTVLTTCVDGEAVEADCADGGQICHDMGEESHCMDEGAMEM